MPANFSLNYSAPEGQMIGEDTILLLETNFESAEELIPTTGGLSFRMRELLLFQIPISFVYIFFNC